MFDNVQYDFFSLDIDMTCDMDMDMVKPYDPEKEGFDLLDFEDIKVEVGNETKTQKKVDCKQEDISTTTTTTTTTTQIKEEVKTNIATIIITKADDDNSEEDDAEVDALKNQKSDQLCRLYLWYFLLELLEMEGTQNIISWTNKDTLEFKIHDAKRLAVMWGSMHGRENMTYAKFSRALRYHYKKGVLQKVQKKRYCYQFLRCAKIRYAMENDALKKKTKFNEQVKSEFANNVRLHNEKQQQQEHKPVQKRKRSTVGARQNKKTAISKVNSAPQFLEPPQPLSRMSSHSSEDTASNISDMDRFNGDFDDMEIPDIDFTEYLTSTDISKDIPDINVQDIVDELSDDLMETLTATCQVAHVPESTMILNRPIGSSSIDQSSYTFYNTRADNSSQYSSYFQQTYQATPAFAQQQSQNTILDLSPTTQQYQETTAPPASATISTPSYTQQLSLAESLMSSPVVSTECNDKQDSSQFLIPSFSMPEMLTSGYSQQYSGSYCSSTINEDVISPSTFSFVTQSMDLFSN